MADPLIPQGYVLDPEQEPTLPAGYKLDQPGYDPSYGYMRFGQNGLQPAFNPDTYASPMGVLRGGKDYLDKTGELAARGFEALAPSSLSDTARQFRDSLEAAHAQSEQNYQQQYHPGGPTAPDAGRNFGQMLAGGALTAAVPEIGGAGLIGRGLQAAIGGGLSNVLSQPAATAPPSSDYWGDVRRQVGEGAVAGIPAALLGAGAGRIVSPSASTNPYVQTLLAHDIYPSPGQLAGASGGAIGRTLGNWEESLAGSLPGPGDIMAAGRAGAMRGFTAGAMNDALAPIGQTLSPGVEGRAAYNDMYQKISDAYNRAVPNAGSVLPTGGPWGGGWQDDVQNLQNMSQFMKPAQRDQFNAILKGAVLDKINVSTNYMSGQSFKEAEETLGKNASAYLYNHTSGPDDRQLGEALREAQSQLRGWLQASNPEAAAEIGAANQAYARMLPIETASVRRLANQEPGYISPADLMAGLRQYTSAGRLARGQGGVGQDYAEAAQNVLGNRVPNSGTAYRGMGVVGAGLGASALAGKGLDIDPATLAAAAVGTGTAAGAYSPWGRQLTAFMMARRPAAAAPLANATLNNPGVAAGMLTPQIANSFAPLYNSLFGGQ